MSIGDYYTKLKGLWDARDALSPLPPCDGDIAKKLQEYQQTQRTNQFLMRLNPVYAGARGQILLMDPLPPVNKVFSLIIQDEKQQNISSQVTGKTPDAAAFAVKDGPPNLNMNYSPRNPHLKCDHCNLVGHTTENCRQHLQCDPCGYRGYTIDICHKLKRANAQGDKRGPSKSYVRAHHADSTSNKAETTHSHIVSLLINIVISLNSLIEQNRTNIRGRRLGWELSKLDSTTWILRSMLGVVSSLPLPLPPLLIFGTNALVTLPIKPCKAFLCV
ncbi:uncharacterized protein LOC112094098 [Morus notabilis]|uniref:uncharacterized protein LOC112094098 n=1 Tax=Morus notabilis TaxID=981085 RepID=UPI000CED53FD|nr:uncharacterized protein LOC112094098 [Morus notabilis]